MKYYEYKTIKKNDLLNEHRTFIQKETVGISERKLNELGNHGWELIYMTPTQLIFKRDIN